MQIKPIPVFIISYNRPTYLKRIINWLEKISNIEIIIVDNMSTYQPLLDFYKETKYEVIKLKENLAGDSPWHAMSQHPVTTDYFIVTDDDVLPIDECPLDAVDKFIGKLESNPEIHHVGFSLKIDDIPNHYPYRNLAFNNEARFWGKMTADGYFEACIGTTFAVYRKGAGRFSEGDALRSSYPYTAKHLPFYEDFGNLTEEQKFYLNSVVHNKTAYSEKGKEQL